MIRTLSCRAAVLLVAVVLFLQFCQPTPAYSQVPQQQAAAGYSFKHLYDFCRVSGCSDGAEPNGDLIFDPSGNLYGTSDGGGSSACQAIGCGTVFELSPQPDGSWKHTVLFKFDHNSGSNPPAGLARDSAGNLYGTTQTFPDPGGVFQLSPHANGKWKLTRLFTFNRTDGSAPLGRLMVDTAGNVYGTTEMGGDFTACPTEGCGTVYQLSPQKDGTWKHTIFFAFNNKNGRAPAAGVIADTSGNLYGTTDLGANSGCLGGCGTVYRLSPTNHGKWRLTTLHKFSGTDGANPGAGLLLDSSGNLYGTTVEGGADGVGTVFQLSPQQDGSWKLTTIATFDVKNGSNPLADLVMDRAGNLYGNTSADGGFGIGVVFRLSPEKNGKWKQTTILTFNEKNGAGATGGLALDSTGNLYGTSPIGGKHVGGIAFELSPK